MIDRIAGAIMGASHSDYRIMARAAITAMREPSDEMIICGSIDPGSGGPDDGYSKEVYQAMIDAALKEI